MFLKIHFTFISGGRKTFRQEKLICNDEAKSNPCTRIKNCKMVHYNPIIHYIPFPGIGAEGRKSKGKL